MKEKKVGKIGICGLVGIVVCVIGWGLEVRGLLEKYGLQEVLIYGLGGGL